ncbi:hypothetical protein HGM15179_009686, partial [Zosterops borbonicus]
DILPRKVEYQAVIKEKDSLEIRETQRVPLVRCSLTCGGDFDLVAKDSSVPSLK